MRKEALLRRGGALIRSWGRGLAEILYPEGAVCLGCGRLSDGECLCQACREELRYSDVLDSWQLRDIGGVPVWCMRPHRDLPRKLVLRLKHGTEARAAKAMAGMLRDRPDYFLHPAPGTVVTWVPGPKGRIRERCIDHGKRLAEAVAAELGLECRPLLIRKKNDRAQARLNREARRENLKKTFAPAERIGCPVLLVDDVLTTGTTARRCLEALREGGAEEIEVLTVTKAAG